jgi:hypothetical protein
MQNQVLNEFDAKEDAVIKGLRKEVQHLREVLNLKK